MRRCERSVIWRSDAPGNEYCTLWAVAQGWELRGAIVAVIDGGPLLATYRVSCDARWNTREVQITAERGDATGELRLIRDEEDRWWHGDQELAEVRGCVDVDLELTPATNTLPIRRLRPAIGETIELQAAWVRFPQLTVEPLRQRYTRLGGAHYRYESEQTGFTAELDLDDLDLVTRYGDIWARESAKP